MNFSSAKLSKVLGGPIRVFKEDGWLLFSSLKGETKGGPIRFEQGAEWVRGYSERFGLRELQPVGLWDLVPLFQTGGDFDEF